MCICICTRICICSCICKLHLYLYLLCMGSPAWVTPAASRKGASMGMKGKRSELCARGKWEERRCARPGTQRAPPPPEESLRVPPPPPRRPKPQSAPNPASMAVRAEARPRARPPPAPARGPPRPPVAALLARSGLAGPDACAPAADHAAIRNAMCHAAGDFGRTFLTDRIGRMRKAAGAGS